MQINPISPKHNFSIYSKPAFKANILNYEQIYTNLKTTPIIRVGDDRSYRLIKLEGIKKLINSAGDKLTNIFLMITGHQAGMYSHGRKTLYKIDVTNERFPNMKYSEKLDMFSGSLDPSGESEQILDKLTDEYVIKTAPRAEAFTMKRIRELETKLLAKISLAAGKMPLDVLKMYRVETPYWKEIANDAAKTVLSLTPEELIAEQKEFQKHYAEFLNLKTMKDLRA